MSDTVKTTCSGSMRRDAIVAYLSIPRDGYPQACGEALAWLRSLPASTTWEQAWQQCERGDWLLCICLRLGVDRHWRVAASCACARGVWHLMHDPRSHCAIEVAELWSQGLASDSEIDAAGDAARAAVLAAAGYAARSAAWAAAWAASEDAAGAAAWDAAGDAAWDAAGAAVRAADWDAAEYAARAAAWADAWDAALKSCAKRVRKVIQWRKVAERLEVQP